MGKKKEKTSKDKVIEFLVKIKNVFNKDIFIKDNYCIFAGRHSNDSIYGDVICYLEPEYKIAIEDFFGIHDLIKIEDVVLVKKLLAGDGDEIEEESEEPLPEKKVDLTKVCDLDTLIEQKLVEFMEKDNPTYSQLDELQKRITETFNQVEEWKSFTKYPIELLETVFSNNSYIEFRESADMPYVTLGKKLFPLVTLKNMENLYFKTVPLEQSGLNAFCVNFSFSHFRVDMIYYFLALNN